ncbi:sialate O-acetylesterase [Draconibacterium orientale]|uniref:Chitooligosaccharide deacetylase n=1 Tax=Draconibacterium orientale TaxID=1168034 RepID=X5DFF9_9BACT|nr:polysaccharide deacetylase family protein [Draconibacterium orientale]AHW59127.1 chitooligosaccharide deacetylase [Draconibacterium orientale]SET72679.1 sialate O-acetylesterase [Draconibacterium orientale]
MRTLLIFILTVFAFTSNAQFTWPNGAKAAVVFTYDDALDCHLDIAVPQLDEFGLKGTFFCTGNSPCLYNRTEEWRAITKRGHELGNHTLFHPCDGTGQDWVKPEYDLRAYTPEQIVAELKTANTLLKAVDGNTERSYGYTCSNYVANGVDFTDSVKNIFVAARCDGPIPETMDDYKTWKTPSYMSVDPDIQDLITQVEEARAKGTIVVFMFHNVGGGYLNTAADVHKKLLQYVSENQGDFYNDSFINVMKYVKENQ